MGEIAALLGYSTAGMKKEVRGSYGKLMMKMNAIYMQVMQFQAEFVKNQQSAQITQPQQNTAK